MPTNPVPEKLSPEVEALIAKVVAQPKRELTREEIETWAKRLAEDVGGLCD